MSLWTFASEKGGVTKTTAALANAGLLSRYYRVAFTDLDEAAYATTMGLGQAPHPNPLEAAPIPIAHPLLRRGQLLLYPGGEAMGEASEAAVAAHLARCAAAADIVVVDSPPGRRHPTVLAALRAATVVVVPILPDFQALAGFEKLMGTYQALGLSGPVRALLSRWEAKTNLARDVQRELVASHPGIAVSAIIPKDQRAAEAPAAALPVTLYAPKSRSSVAYSTAAYEIAASSGLRIPKEAF